MFLNTSFRFRKNHLYKLKTYKATQETHTIVLASPLHIVLKANRSKVIAPNAFSAFRRQLGRKTEKLFRLHLFRRPDTMVTAKPREIRMGKGKGAFSHVHLPIRSGTRLINFGWCHRLCGPLVLGGLRKAIKKFGVSVHF